jgi:tRNA(Ile)-lysidine synthase
MLCEMARRCGAEAVATAHHRDDQAETVIFRMLRGTGFRGLCGIRPIGELEGLRFIRPMLGVSRREIEDYLRQEELAWRQDHTNADCGFARNRIRHQILPALEEESGGLVVAGLADLAQRSQCLFERIEAGIERKLPMVIQSEYPDRMDLDRSALADCSPLVAGEMIRRCLEAMEVGLRDYSSRHYQELLHAIYTGRPIRSHLPGGVECSIEEKTVSFRRTAEAEVPLPEEPISLEPGKISRFGPFDVDARLLDFDRVSYERFQKEKTIWMEWLDADKICGPIRIRARKAGDRFRPLGMKTDKKVGKFLTTARIDPDIKSRVFIVEDAEKILWAAPVRISESAKVSEETGRILQIRINLLHCDS